MFTVGEDHATGWEAGHSTLSTFALGLGAFAGLPRSPSSARRRLSAAQHMRHGSRPLKVLAAACANPRSMVRVTSMLPQAVTWTTVEAPIAKVSARIRMPMCRHLPRIARSDLPDNSLGKQEGPAVGRQGSIGAVCQPKTLLHQCMGTWAQSVETS